MATEPPTDPPIYPPLINLSYFFARKEFQGERGTEQIEPDPAATAGLEVHCSSPVLRNAFLSTFRDVSFHRFGVLKGDYIVHQNGTFLFDMNGDCIVANSSPEHFVINAKLMEMAEQMWDSRAGLVEGSQQFRHIENACVLSSTYAKNYYHYTIDMIAGLHHLDGTKVERIAVPGFCLRKPFQTDLMARAMGNRRLVQFDDPIRVTDPFLIQSAGSVDGLHWLRKQTGFAAKSGSKRYYVRRAPDAAAPSGINLAESPELLRLLAKFGFETVDFGAGEHTIEQQVRMVEGARIILAPHGANLTNIAYLQAPLSVIEISSRRRAASLFAHISARLGFRHATIISDHADAKGDVVVDCGLLEDVLTRLAKT